MIGVKNQTFQNLIFTSKGQQKILKRPNLKF